MTVIVDGQDTSEPLLITGTPGTTDMTFRQVRQLTQFAQKGVMSQGGMNVTSGGAGQVTVASGYCWVPGTTVTGPDGQHMYGVPLTANKTLTGIPSPIGATRRDLVVCKVYDNGDGDGSGQIKGQVQYIKNAAESLTPEAAPANSLILAYVDVTTGGAITITDRRDFSGPTLVGIDGDLWTMRIDDSGLPVLRNVTDALDGLGSVSPDRLPALHRALGTTMLAATLDPCLGTAGSALGDGVNLFGALYLPAKRTITGVGFYQSVQGNYTADNNNKIGLYTSDGTTLTRVAQSANNGNLWKAAANTYVQEPFSATYEAEPGVYFVAGLYNQSAQVTAPSILQLLVNNAAIPAAKFPGNVRITGQLTGQTDMAASTTFAGLTTNGQIPFFYLY